MGKYLHWWSIAKGGKGFYFLCLHIPSVFNMRCIYTSSSHAEKNVVVLSVSCLFPKTILFVLVFGRKTSN